MKRLYYIRHGQSVMNVQGLFAGHTDTPLTDEGRSQAKLAGQNAKNQGIDLILSSPLSRAHETARIFASEIGYPIENIEVIEDLIERNFGVIEGTSWSPENSAPYNTLGNKVFPEGMETIDEIIARANVVLEHARNHPSGAKNVLLVGHGGIGRALRYHAVPGADYHEQIPNAQLVRWI